MKTPVEIASPAPQILASSHAEQERGPRKRPVKERVVL